MDRQFHTYLNTVSHALYFVRKYKNVVETEFRSRTKCTRNNCFSVHVSTLYRIHISVQYVKSSFSGILYSVLISVNMHTMTFTLVYRIAVIYLSGTRAQRYQPFGTQIWMAVYGCTNTEQTIDLTGLIIHSP